MESSLFDRLGGEIAVETAAARFYRRVFAAPDIAPFFAGYDLAVQVDRHIPFMLRAFGAPGASVVIVWAERSPSSRLTTRSTTDASGPPGGPRPPRSIPRTRA